MNDDEIVALYLARNERAIDETQKKYGKYLRHIARNVLGDENDAEECENDVYMKLWHSIPPTNPQPLKPYLASVCRKTALDLYDRKTASKRGAGQTAAAIEELEETLALSDGEDLADLTALRCAMQKFVDGLNAAERAVFLGRYFYMYPVKEIAEKQHLRENHVHVLLCRTRQKLKAFLEKEGFQL